MKLSLKVSAMTMLLFVICASLVLPCESQAVSSEQISINTYKAFLTNVLGVDLSQYNLTRNGYGVSYPPKFGGVVKEETISYILNSSQSAVSTWCVLDNGNITVCSIYAIQGSVVYAQPQTSDILESTRNFMEKYEQFSVQFYAADTAYLQQSLASLDDVNAPEPTSKILGDMNLKIAPSSASTNIQWTYTQPNFNATSKKINLKFENGHITWFGDTWNLYSVSTGTLLPKEEAKSLAFDEVQNSHNVTFASFQGSTMVPISIKPDWSNMTYEVTLEMAPGKVLQGGLPPTLSNIYPTITNRDPLKLYPIWHFVFYFSKPIGDTVGVEIGVWGDSKEIAFCQDYGYLGGSTMPTPTPQAANSVGSNEEVQSGLSQRQAEYILIIVGVAAAISVGSYLAIRRRTKR
jgi:hypothetical protein